MFNARPIFAASFIALSAVIGCSGTIGEPSAPGSELDEERAPAAELGSEGEGRDAPGHQSVVANPSEATSPAESDGGESPTEEPAPETPASEPIAVAVTKEIARELASMKSSTYTHTTSIDEKAGRFDFDCSGFVGYALSKSNPKGFAAIQAASIDRPLAKHFEEFFASIPVSSSKGGWRRIVKPLDLLPGDIFSWTKPADLVSDNTGHVGFIVGLPTVNPARADEVIVPIADSTASPHGAKDSRTAAGATGLGTGSIGIRVDASGSAQAYYWTGGSSTKAWSTSVAFGRAD